LFYNKVCQALSIDSILFYFCFRKNGTLRPRLLEDLGNMDNFADYIESEENTHTHVSRFFFHHTSRPSLNHVLLFFKYQHDRRSDKKYIGCHWIEKHTNLPFAAIQQLLRDSVGLTDEIPLKYYDEVRRYRIDPVSTLSALKSQDIGNGDIIIITQSTSGLDMIQPAVPI
jgi:hypothetical protein